MKYNNSDNTSFAIGQFAVIEILKCRPEKIVGVYYSNKLNKSDKIVELFDKLHKLNIKVLERTRFIESLSEKENVYLVAEFFKYDEHISEGNHLVLVNPSDMGNFGTIVRTALGFNISNIAIIKPAVDIFNPKVVRASMGAIFNVKVQYFNSFEEYNKKFENNLKYMFCLQGTEFLQNVTFNKDKHISLVFGNEGAGIPEEVLKYGKKVKIMQSDNIDSFNLSVSVGMGLYELSKSTMLHKG